MVTSLILCSVCGRKFNLKASLSAHLRSHAGEKPSACPLCSKKFRRKSLKNHMRVPQGRRQDFARGGTDVTREMQMPLRLGFWVLGAARGMGATGGP